MDGCAHALAHFPRVRQWGAGRRSWCRLRADGAIHWGQVAPSGMAW